MKKLKRVVIKEELVELVGDFKPAIILNQFIYWTERMFDTDKYIKEEKERALKESIEVDISESCGWIYKTSEELNEELMIGMSVPTIRKYIKQLVEAGYIHERRNPKYKWDKTMQYRVNMVKVQMDLGKMGYALEGYKLLPNIKIVDEVEEVEMKEETKKDLSSGLDKPLQNDATKDADNNLIDTPSICENTNNIQVENNNMEENRKKALESLYGTYEKDVVDNWNSVNLEMRIHMELKKMGAIE